MKKIIGFMAALTFVIMFATTSYAQESSPRVDTRQTAQRARIVEGRSSGEVTNREAAVLRGQQRHIRRAERRAIADGDITRSERRRLERKQNKASRTIRRAKNNKLDNN